MVYVDGLKPKVPNPNGAGLNADLAREIAACLLAGQSDDLIKFRLASRSNPDDIQRHINLAKQNPFFQGAMGLNDRLNRMDWVLDTQRRTNANDTAIKTVPRRSGLTSEQFFKEHYTAHRPVILTDLIDDWPATKLWNMDYLDQKIGRNTTVTLQKGRDKVDDFEIQKVRLTSEITFGELTDFIRTDTPSNDMYVTANNGAQNRAAFDPVWADFAPIPGITQAPDGFLWIGPKGTLTPFHHDLTHNLLIQVTGRKKVHIIPSWEESKMKPFRKYFSGWSLDELLKTPEDKRPTLIECEIGPGDALFIPVGWWHHVIGLEASISVLFTNFIWPNDYTNPYMLG